MIIKLQLPYSRKGHKPPPLILDQAAQGPVQPGLEHLQGQVSTACLGSLFQMPQTSQHRDMSTGVRPVRRQGIILPACRVLLAVLASLSGRKVWINPSVPSGERPRLSGDRTCV